MCWHNREHKLHVFANCFAPRRLRPARAISLSLLPAIWSDRRLKQKFLYLAISTAHVALRALKKIVQIQRTRIGTYIREPKL